ncbi:hypothetical protein CS542_03440 [Pedobacter sp. IW39]|nr:hypothetical protein CS542_03440 [Pedobacter sp. IW39]
MAYRRAGSADSYRCSKLHNHAQEVMLEYYCTANFSFTGLYPGNVIISADSEIYGHKDTDQASTAAKKHMAVMPNTSPSSITRVYQEESEAENAFKLLIKVALQKAILKLLHIIL